MGLGEDPAQADLVGPALAEDLVDLTAVVRPDALRVPGIGDLEIVFTVEQFLVDALAASLEDLPHLSRERGVPDLAGHLLAGPNGSRIQRTEPGDLAEPGLIERIVLRAGEQPVARVHANKALHGQLDFGPQCFEECRIGRHLMLAIRPQDTAGLAVHRQARPFSAMVDDAGLRVHGRCEIGAAAEIAFQERERAGQPHARSARRGCRCLRSSRRPPSRKTVPSGTSGRSTWQGSTC